MKKRTAKLQFEWNLIVLVTTALTLFGLVMVYSATSSSAALGNGNPVGYLERQGAYAVIGITLTASPIMSACFPRSSSVKKAGDAR